VLKKRETTDQDIPPFEACQMDVKMPQNVFNFGYRARGDETDIE
jgi:hypothetical protein